MQIPFALSMNPDFVVQQLRATKKSLAGVIIPARTRNEYYFFFNIFKLGIKEVKTGGMANRGNNGTFIRTCVGIKGAKKDMGGRTE